MKDFINNKKKMFSLLVFGIVMVLLGVTYAWFNYYQEGSNRKLIAGDIYLSLNDGQEQISLENVFPMTKEEARGKTNNFITFSVGGVNESPKDVYYEIKLVYGDSKTGYTRFNDKDLVFDLIEIGQNNEETYIVDAKSFDSINDKKIWVDTINSNTTTQVTKNYKLRMWLNEDVIISDNCATDNCVTGEKAFKKHYASVKLSVFGDFTEKEAPGIVNKFKKIKDNGATYIKSYDDIIVSNPSFTTQDQVSSTAPALANGNLLFAGYCWQIVRTTDNGGLRIIYNGVAVNNKCETDRTVTKGVNATGKGTTQNLSSTTTFGTGYTYDVTNSRFTLTGLMTGKSWSTNYTDLIGTYTCLGTDTTCSTLISINGYSNSTTAYVAKYTIGDVDHYSQLGTSPFNANYQSPAMVGYMFNKVKKFAGSSAAPEGSIYGMDVEYSNGSYLVIENTSGVASTNTTKDESHHYTCGTAGTTSCTTVRFYYYNNYYIDLEKGETVESVLKDMINYKTNQNDADANINHYNSTIKGYLDNWYNQNLNNPNYTKYLDNKAVYCNDRSVSNIGSWNKNSANMSTTLQFRSYNDYKNLKCENDVDRFNISNMKATLIYPIGLLTESERNLIGGNYAKTSQNYWGALPYSFGSTGYANVHYVGTVGNEVSHGVDFADGVRPVLTLSPDTEILEGSGTYTDPYVVGDKVTRTY